MKIYHLLTLLLMFSLISSCSNSSEPEQEIQFNVYKGYSYKSSNKEIDSTFYYEIKSKEEFENLFFYISDHNSEPRISEKEMANNNIISIVKRSNNYCTLNIKTIKVENRELIINYSSKVTNKNMSWTATVPIIATFKANYSKIKFVENGILQREL